MMCSSGKTLELSARFAGQSAQDWHTFHRKNCLKFDVTSVTGVARLALACLQLARVAAYVVLHGNYYWPPGPDCPLYVKRQYFNSQTRVRIVFDWDKVTKHYKAAAKPFMEDADDDVEGESGDSSEAAAGGGSKRVATSSSSRKAKSPGVERHLHHHKVSVEDVLRRSRDKWLGATLTGLVLPATV